MGAITPLHLILILAVAVLVIGPGKLPETGAALGKAIRQFREAADGVTNEATATGAPSTATTTAAPTMAPAPLAQVPMASSAPPAPAPMASSIPPASAHMASPPLASAPPATVGSATIPELPAVGIRTVPTPSPAPIAAVGPSDQAGADA